MPVLENTKVNINDTVPGVTILRQEDRHDFPKDSKHLNNTQLYPVFNEAFICRPAKGELYITLKLEECYGSVLDAIQTLMKGIPHKESRDDPKKVFELRGVKNIKDGLTALFTSGLSFDSSLFNKQTPRPFINDALKESLYTELKHIGLHP